MPDLNYVKPDSKRALTGTETASFEVKNDEGEGCQRELEVTFALDGKVAYVDNLLSEAECQVLCDAVDKSDALTFWSEAGRDNDKARAFRDADTIEVHSEEIAGTMWARVEHLLNNVISVGDDYDEVNNPNWERELPGDWAPSGFNHDLLFAKYPSGGAFSPHTDGRAIHHFNRRSFRSVIIFLNDIPLNKGGGTNFYKREALDKLQQEKEQEGEDEGGGEEEGEGTGGRWTAPQELLTLEVSPKAGRLLVFDQDLVHEGVPPSSPLQKYIIRSDVMYSRMKPVCDSAVDREAYALFQEAEVLGEAGQVQESIVKFRRAIKMSPGLAEMMGH